MSEANFKLDASVRTDLGKGASRRLRREDKLPGIIYGGEEAPVSITLDHNKVNNSADFEAFYSHVLEINLDGKVVEVLVKDMQRHPFKPKITHIDFQRVIAGQDVHTNVPLHFVNEEKSAAVKAGGIAEHHVTEIEVTCLPKNLPEFIEVDMAGVEMGQTLHLSDLTLPAGVSSVELAKNDEAHDLAVVTVKPAPKAAEAEEDGEEAASEE
ncbi:MAG: 50S ribosomal protein L25/general stress protein Ctc [Alteromonas macleodii]|jgi:large subunit ribosomal protein L25|uniref:50S ribosomal protein L25/general stress protein Ctc n=1 Tax=unclassified Alteromonas TaxID=2614992 RepID=UPI000AB72BF1|nr:MULTISPECIES: 50S ribosomal protein L25/general stress protein Ctc [unclassified Alteromonas]MCG7637971.1 50S ribosomal protein L25/general stress protein Ctc [Alteromonas sp. CNT1-28]MCG7813462.1 50S ribosomal protein L25/general stress protein Ctc [Alteromonas sp. MCA-1]MDK2763992.1 50S ribosomal protein L25/general stress protein Ctc [Alteromonas macleodii]PTU00866.1 50S ribosomal protein L25 [Pseudomonas sp. HMWF031]|mmetsp:Transcript_8704/g.28662  ORF Transcript_8704/g.28662 Transcript_8704/m.28662 type:complete len:211 (+) Transcript_8704:122-754(+)|eukprot:CAMPEP_0170156518 /NCGR_PEP_ID=MMETSP0033_2-20121228/63371_1 /TAXON_ID=195969 /ORGANISM="Dolichomastix tenuilepis, Strain CCMP3274" /LENGTH=210 /DNA_ID=CAMNT_0010393875 /DNA_START=53 /DNA_END=685 /DNA_ORIENTATION=+